MWPLTRAWRSRVDGIDYSAIGGSSGKPTNCRTPPAAGIELAAIGRPYGDDERLEKSWSMNNRDKNRHRRQRITIIAMPAGWRGVGGSLPLSRCFIC
jgi:hypothetical protein